MLHRAMKHASRMKYIHMKHASYEALLLHAWSMLHRSYEACFMGSMKHASKLWSMLHRTHEACFIIMKHASWDLWSMLHAWSKNASYEACFMWTYFILEACFISLWSMLHRSNLLHFCFIHEALQILKQAMNQHPLYLRFLAIKKIILCAQKTF